MDKRFLNKVIDQIVRETMVDYDKRVITFPYFHQVITFPYFHQDYPVSINLPSRYPIPPIHTKPSFDRHCKNVYGLNVKEIEYVWNEYRDTIKDKIYG
jgi:hypothetical protein